MPGVTIFVPICEVWLSTRHMRTILSIIEDWSGRHAQSGSNRPLTSNSQSPTPYDESTPCLNFVFIPKKVSNVHIGSARGSYGRQPEAPAPLCSNQRLHGREHRLLYAGSVMACCILLGAEDQRESDRRGPCSSFRIGCRQIRRRSQRKDR